MYSFPNFEQVYCSMSGSNSCFLTYIQVSQEAGKVVWNPVKGFSVVNEVEVDVILEFSCFFCDPAYVGNFISGSSAFSKSSLNIWKFLVHILLKPGLEDFEHNLTSMWNKCNCGSLNILDIDLLWDCNESWLFPVLWPLLCFPNLLAYWVQHFHSIIF